MVAIRMFVDEEDTRGPFVLAPLRDFLSTGKGDGSDLDQLRWDKNVIMGCAWRARYRETPTSEYTYVELPETWERFDPAARTIGVATLPAPDARAPRPYKS